MSQISFRDIEQLSAYLDDGLLSTERARLETRLANDPQLASALRALTESRALLRQLPQRRAPRNFTLTPKMAGVKPPLPRSYPVFRFASALAAIMFFFASALNLVAPRVPMFAASAPMGYGRGGGGGAEDAAMEQSAASTEAPAEKVAAPAALDLTATPAGTPAPESLVAPTPTAEMLAANAPTAEPTLVDDSARNIGGGADPYLESQMARPVPPAIPYVWIWGFIIVAVITGGIAYLLRWRTDKQFDQTKRK